MQILHLWRERADSAQFMAKILHLRRKRTASCTNQRRNFAFTVGKEEFYIKLRGMIYTELLTVETLKNRCSNICILRAYGENTCQGPLFGGNKKRNRKTSEAQTKGINL